MKLACLFALITLLGLTEEGSLGSHQERDRDTGRRGRFVQRAPDENDAFSEQYAIVIENNIFLRDRRQRQAPTTATTQQEAPSDPLKDWVLVGVVFEEGEFRAYFENLKQGGITRAVVGDAIASGSLGEVFLDAVGFTTADGLKWIEIGQDLTGQNALIPQVQRPVVAATPPAQGASPGTAPNGSTMSIEERLRQRRLQETGGARTGAGAARGAQPGVPPQPGELPPDAIIEGDMVIVPVGKVTPEGEVIETIVVPQRVPPPTDQAQRVPPPTDQPQRRPG